MIVSIYLDDHLKKFILSKTFNNSRWADIYKDKKWFKKYISLYYRSSSLSFNEMLTLFYLDEKLKDLSIVLNLSRERCRQIKFKALLKLLAIKTFDEKRYKEIINEMEQLLKRVSDHREIQDIFMMA